LFIDSGLNLQENTRVSLVRNAYSAAHFSQGSSQLSCAKILLYWRNMNQAFVVEVTEKPESTPEESVESLAKAFNISSRKIELMLKRLPGVATKPISQQEAAVVVTYFEQAGLKAVVKSVTMPSSVGASTSTAHTSPNISGSSNSSTPAPSQTATSSDIARARLASLNEVKTESTPVITLPAATPPETAPTIIQPPRAVTMNSAPPVIEVSPVAEVSPPVSIKPLDVSELFSSLRPSTTQPAHAQATTPAQTLPKTAVIPASETRPEHDILRTTLIGEPDLRKTQDLPTMRLGFPATTAPGKLSNRLLLSAILPTLLTLLGSLLVTYLMVQPALSEQFQNSSRNPAVAIASGLSSILTATPTGEPDYTKLQSSINVTRSAFAGQDVYFIVVTDTQGEILPASWFASSSFMTDDDVRGSIEAQSSSAITNQTLTPPSLIALEAQAEATASQLEVIAQPLRFQEKTIGAVVVGITSANTQTNIWRILGSVALLSLVPLALASLLAIVAVRPITRRVSYLTQRANDISRGNLSDMVELKGNDELSELGEALERLRVSMQSALDRLRRRR
jgi:HAMP domain-containing protein